MRIGKSNTKKIATKMSALLVGATMVVAGPFSTLFANAASEGAGSTKYHTDFSTYAEEQEYANKLNEEIAAEGSILLKNNSALPLQAKERNVTVFGIGSVGWLFGGKGSGAGSADVELTINDSLREAGFNVNPKVEAFYQQAIDNGDATVTIPNMPSTAQNPSVNVEVGPNALGRGKKAYGFETIRDSYANYADAAIVVLTRDMAGYTDGSYYNVPDHTDKTDHELMLSDNEKAILEEVTSRFDKVIYVINCVNPMELAPLEDNDKVDAILWSGYTGSTGALAIGRIFKGEVNPSGKTTDIFPANFKNDPSYVNSGDGSQNNDDHTQTNIMLDKDGKELAMSNRNR